MYKKILFSLSILYLTGCTVAKPVVLNASYKQLNQIKKAYTQDNTRNGANNIVFAARKSTSVVDPENNNKRIDFLFALYITPHNNPLSFSYDTDQYNIGRYPEDGQYKSFTTSLFFQTKVTARIVYHDIQANTNEEIYEKSDTMQLSRIVQNIKVFKMYKLPYDTYTRPQRDETFVYSYIYNNSLEVEYNSVNDQIKINPYQYKYDRYMNFVYNNEIYNYYTATFDIDDFLPNNPDSPNRLNQLYYYDFETLGAINNIDYRNKLEDYTNLNRLKDIVKYQTFDFLGLQHVDTNTSNIISYQYNASLSEERSAYSSGYNAGIEEGQAGTGTTRVQQVFRAIQSFLNIDFGFFKLAHVLGGMLVIAIVIFVVRWFR